ncbi:glycosyltransferase family 4 protein [Maritimibacter dapengensis]|uniref:Glycosyltransferase family 4 protein n=1 Tax=Maritimibacter dapengensis TaxID=2836868 RepID=A0ABS6T4P8_9RHOB|nr:glycosyltransferase family 4 protein [Maritimibacter dapengensis]MBV7380165.1 glycosyltransferase family 4 protein [Maritimibacter dapengensis]
MQPAPHVMIDALNLNAGGGSVVMARLAKALVLKGSRVTVLTARELPECDLAANGVNILPIPGAHGAIRAYIYRATRLDRLAHDAKADALVSFNYFSPVTLPQATYHINVIPFLPFRQRRAAVGMPRALLQPRAAHAALGQSSINLFESAHLRELARSSAPEHETDHVAYAGIDIPSQSGPRHSPPRVETVCMITSGAPHKQNTIALSAFRAFAVSRPMARLEIFGNTQAIRSSLSPGLRSFCDNSGQVAFRGYVDRDTLYGTLSTAFALLTASELESFYMVALEAMIVGCPVIAADISSVRESTGEAAQLFPAGDWRAAAFALDDLTDPDWWCAVSQNGYEWARHFDARKLSASFADKILSLIDREAA